MYLTSWQKTKHAINIMKKADMLPIAKEKAKALPVGCQIRVTAEEHSYTLYNYEGVIYIGWPIKSPLGKFYKNKQVYQQQTTGKGITAEMQIL